ncbi:hypothetical protein DENSPDRAFT_816598 [Dentipellis sp. KUC8613]|nr:hypothetical protein DENSPDRAFT_816598 [Dentipellis sp. KUC8613]
MTTTELIRQLRLSLGSSPQAEKLEGVLALVDQFVLECASSPEPEVLLFHLEDELQAVHRDVFHHEQFHQMELFLSVLYHLTPVLSPTSLISTWFELILRPALREPKLPNTAIAQAKDLVLTALKQKDENYSEKQGEFRRRILDLYLLDAFNEGSGEDMLEWADLPQAQREKRNVWKSNLEDILVKFGMDEPQALLTQVFHCFLSPSSRLQLLNLMDQFTCQPDFIESQAAVLASHPLMQSMLTSLLVDNSTTVFSIALKIVAKLITVFAVKECNQLKRMLPRLFAIYARLICWQERQPVDVEDGASSDDSEGTASGMHHHAVEGSRALDISPDFQWQRLEMIFDATAAPAPSPKRYFSILYYLYPCNLLSFLRRPAEYLVEKNEECPYSTDWEEALDEDQIKTKSEILLREHITHPLIIWRTATSELTEPEFFASYEVNRIISESMLLQNQNSRLVFEIHDRNHEPSTSEEHKNPDPPPNIISPEADKLSPDSIASATPRIGHPNLARPPSKIQISLQEMVNTSIALKTGLDYELTDPTPVWPYSFFPSNPMSSSASSEDDSTCVDSQKSSPERDGKVPSHIMEAMAGLQREVLLLRNELNFELWIKRENVKRIGRLFRTQILSRNAEAERQALHNKLREYKLQVNKLQRQLKEHEKQTILTKTKNQEWIDGQQKKIQDLREKKKKWTSETAALRLAEEQLRAHFAAQGALLAEAEKRVFELETAKKESTHKIDRLHDYEKRIEQLTALQKMWDADVEKYKAQSEVMRVMLSKYKKMEIRLETLEKVNADMDEQARASRRQIQALDAQLAREKQAKRPRRTNSNNYAGYAEEVASLRDASRQLREENGDLKDEIDELKAMVEVLRSQVKGTRGVSMSPSQSPILGSSMRLGS